MQWTEKHESPRAKSPGRFLVSWAAHVGGVEVGRGPEAAVAPQVGGMSCSSCSSAVEAALKRHPGVLRAHVALTTQEARVEYGPLLGSEVQPAPGLVSAATASACPRSMSGQLHSRLAPLPISPSL